MNRQYPIYTEKTDCRDCYKCVRHCPVKAIKIENGHATVIPERCIACGLCVHTCPAGAKKVRNDVARTKNLLQRKDKVIASLAPSYAGEWPDTAPGALAGALKQLGFYAVSETALGAEAVTHSIAESLKHAAPGLHISTACPVVVDHIRKYRPEFTGCLSSLLSPMQAHARLLKAHYGPDTAVVFIGPCIAKKCESDAFDGLTDIALTFQETAEWLDECGIIPEEVEPAVFEPEPAAHGALYPVVGGMNKTLEDYDLPDTELLAMSGIDAILQTLENLDTESLDVPVFLEALACPGGCIGGPQTKARHTLLTGELAIRRNTEMKRPAAPAEAVRHTFSAAPPAPAAASESDLRTALERVGKHKPEDELNCGGCGYETCRTFAAALLQGKAEPDMCLSYLRKQAQKKANALLRCMPSGVVIVDDALRVIECNENFAMLAGEGTRLAYEARPGLEGADLRKILPFFSLFDHVNQTGREYHSDTLRFDDRLLKVSIFPIETGKTVGATLLDVTQTEYRRELIAQKAREVIDKNMAAVQDIACKLGEHMADTEILLRSIADDYADAPESHQSRR
ncbi:[Fe-Fe] hydrogenase large subunit C-terminal domain-containing protein [Pontiella agarivorans]|uniref:[Fe-Fe] hydrogenase large subunit C-terminal domain-containing protein n=1 Tax=Pontiella agarivorans TaxID=3038953 RepID=A0ABU5MU88_9BACT|nr:[Fe-Fe] hydrogenase large subunit C-terminal domain-containing protein [Pontiella agarivorans]MDZ8117720.1 [Fe-Fe] hydrogenase large subunit C-terminal domain-containing protein [Pontiella agarivorans]